ncbi:deoxyribonuclease NucA/NucB [Saccharothrix saharensis]|uniref:Deoxyribonuclease NucA/NucB n=2 Tax=Saccharothrix saharensis TaxID=571190 RepID=A0A543J5Q2_9PSEU|nr:deoxyribonuclease NucA/NucB [Saccharothrix saharensis]
MVQAARTLLADRIGHVTTSATPDMRPATAIPRPIRPIRSRRELAEIARPGKVAFPPTASSGHLDAAAEGLPVRDRITTRECWDFFRNASSPPPNYWYKNRFNGCHGVTLLSEHFEVRNGRPTLIAAAFVDAAVMVSMNENTRTGELSVELGNWRWTDGYPITKRWTFGAGCWDVNPSGPECTPDTVSHSDTPQGWGANPRRTATVQFPTGGSTMPDDPSPNEQRRIYEFAPYFYLPNSPGSNSFYGAPNLHLRCDQARTAVNANYARGADCVFHEQAGIFQLSASNPAVAESAQLIRDAQDNLPATKPGTPGTWIPGKFGTPYPLTRMYYDTVARDNNRLAAVAECKKHFGPDYSQRNDPNDPTATNDCDEYPFSVTHQGVQMTINANTDRSYAVRPLHSVHNQNAGNSLSQFLADDHLVEEDPFYVLIKD